MACQHDSRYLLQKRPVGPVTQSETTMLQMSRLSIMTALKHQDFLAVPERSRRARKRRRPR